MKLYQTKTAPNARRVRMFLAEKGVNLETIEIDLKAGDNLKPEYRDKNPLAKVPMLELDDGTIISESVAICRYFEITHPTPNLMGQSALEQANIEMWQRRAELAFLFPVAMAFQHCSGYFEDRMTPRKDWGEDNVKMAYSFLKLLDAHLTRNTYLSGDSYSIADITMLTTLDFARVVDIRLNEKHTNIKRWYDLIASRPSAKA